MITLFGSERVAVDPRVVPVGLTEPTIEAAKLAAYETLRWIRNTFPRLGVIVRIEGEPGLDFWFDLYDASRLATGTVVIRFEKAWQTDDEATVCEHCRRIAFARIVGGWLS